MKTSEQRLSEARLQLTEEIVTSHLSEMFERLPMLAGFWLRPDLELEGLSVFTWPGYAFGTDLYDAVKDSLAELAEELPEALQLMGGRTFAREMH